MKGLHYILAGALTGALITACGGGGGGSTVYSKAETKAYLYCAMTSNSRITAIESSFSVPKGVNVPTIGIPIGDFNTVYNLDTSLVNSFLITAGGFGLTGTFDSYSASRKIKYSLLPTSTTFTNLSSSTKGFGKELGTLTFPLTVTGTVPVTSFPVSDISPVVGKNKSSDGLSNITALNGCVINYVTTYK